MRRDLLLTPALALTLAVVAAAQQPAAEVVRLPLDPDRGLPADARARLRLADPGADEWESERWNAALDARLGELARLWAEGRLPAGLEQAGWVAPDLTVAPLAPEGLEAQDLSGPWTLARPGSEPGEAPAALALAQALAAWRAGFEREARLDLEVFEVHVEGQQVVTRVRVLAGGVRADRRLQHNAFWTCRWTPGRDGLVLSGLSADSFEAVALRGQPEGLFADATASLFGDQDAWRRQLTVPLDDWRWRIHAALEPGSLGHHGLAVGDVDGDGLEDLYLCQPGGLPNRLFLHQDDDTLRDVSADAGVDLLDYSSSALLLDLDGEGDLDLLVSTGTAMVFFENDGDARFVERHRIERSLATSLAAADFDADGDLDVYVCSYLSPYERDGLPVPYHAAENGEANVLLRNEGDWSFRDATVEVGLDASNRRFSFAAAWEDFDNDGDQDLYVANDFGFNNLYRNDGGRFVDVARELGAEDVSAGMGVTWGDVDEDGWPDLYVTNMYTPAACRLTAREGFRPEAAASEGAYRDHAMGNSLLINRAARGFEDLADETGTGWGRWGWGSLFVDLDGDGRLDLFAPNGFSTGERRDDLDSYFWRQVVLQSPDRPGESSAAYAQGWRAVNRLVRQGWSWNGHERNGAWLNLGGRRFADVSFVTGLGLPDDARAAARVDWDRDGDEDLLLTSRTAPMLRLLLNRSRPRPWIALRLRGRGGNAAAIGARVSVASADGRRLIRTVRCGEGYLAQSSATVVVGLEAEQLREVEVRWPDGETESFGAPPVASGAAFVLEQGSGRAVALPARSTPSRLVPAAPPAAVAGHWGASSRTVLAVPLGLPRLALETFDGQPASLFGIGLEGPQGTGSPLLLVLWSSSHPACTQALSALGADAEQLRTAGVEVLALGVETGADRPRAGAALRELGWPFAAGFATEQAAQVLELIEGSLHDSARSLPVPSSWLVGADGRLLALYMGRVDPAQVVRDLGLADLSDAERRDAAVPFPGRWIAAPPAPVDDLVASRLASHGLERAAAEYGLPQVETRELTTATFELGLAQARQRQGRLDEAIGHYRKALTVDPALFEAARGLAVALHSKGDYTAARAAYGRALTLEPADATTRCNLGLVLLALGEVEGARRELEALRALSSDLAATLAERIRMVEGGR